MSEETVDEVQLNEEEAKGKHPETVSWKQYVGVKEKLGKEKSELEKKVAELEERTKNAPKPDDLDQAKKAYDDLKATVETLTKEREEQAAKRVSEMRETLKKKGIPDEQVKDADEGQLALMLKTVESFKPRPDLGGGGAAPLGEVFKNPMNAAVGAYNEAANTKKK